MSDEQERIKKLKRALEQLEQRATKEMRGDGDYCSFCGKEKGEVKRLIAGPKVFICDQCIAECNRILNE